MNLPFQPRPRLARSVLYTSFALTGCDSASPVVAPVEAFTPHHQLTDAMLGDSITDRYIVIFKPTVGNAKAESDRMLSRVGGTRQFLYQHVFKGFSVGNLPPGAVNALHKNPNVASVERVAFEHVTTATQRTPLSESP